MAKKNGGTDRISNLPDEICYQILSLLTTNEAVRTSILSTRWRYLYASLSNFDIDFRFLDSRRFFLPKKESRSFDSFTKFMVKMFYFRTEILECFRLKPPFQEEIYIDYERIYDWISAALHRGVRELDLDLSRIKHNSRSLVNHMPPDMFICKTLVTLKLNMDCRPLNFTVPDNVSVPALKILELRGITFSLINDSDSVQRLFSSCPVLEDLSIRDCYSDCLNHPLNITNPTLKRLTIDSYRKQGRNPRGGGGDPYFNYELVLNVPSLVYFKYADFMAEEYSIADIHSLVEADIHIFHDELQDDQQFALAQLLQAMDHVKLKIYLNIDSKVLHFLSDKQLIAFNNMVRLEINHMYPKKPQTGLYEFLQVLPNLQTLVFPCGRFDESRSPSEILPSCLLSHLKEIKIFVYDDSELVEYILRNARVLEKLKIRMCGMIHIRWSIRNKILKLPRRSKKCKIDISGDSPF